MGARIAGFGVLAALLSGAASAAFGPIPLNPDESFGGGGFSRAQLPTAFRPAVVLASGDAIYTLTTEDGGGSEATAYLSRRFAESGALDPGFGTGGTLAHVDVAAGDQAWAGLCLDGATGAIYLTGATVADNAFIVRRFLSDGTPDDTWGTQGLASVTVAGGPAPIALGCRVQPDGKLLVVGSKSSAEAANFSAVNYALVARLTTGGAPDGTFGDAGVVLFAPYVFEAVQFSFELTRAVLDGAGTIYVAGHGIDPRFQSTDLLVAKLTPTGGMGDQYGTGGMNLVRFGPEDERVATARLNSGSQLVVGMVRGSRTGMPEFGVIALRMTIRGDVDVTYGCAGIKAGPAEFPPFLALAGAFDDLGRSVFLGRETIGADEFESVLRTSGLPELALGGSNGTEIAHGCPPADKLPNLGGSLSAPLLLVLAGAGALRRRRSRN